MCIRDRYKDDSEQGTAYDNPDGKPMKESTKYGEAGKVNMLAYIVKNTNEQLGETANTVSYTHLGDGYTLFLTATHFIWHVVCPLL